MNNTSVDGIRQWIRTTLGSARLETHELARLAVAAQVIPEAGAYETLWEIIDTMDDVTHLGSMVSRASLAVSDLVFLHQLTEIEVASGVIDMVLDGMVAPYLGDIEQRIEPDTEVIMVSPPGVSWETTDFGDDRLVGPDEWLTGQAGNWIGLQQVKGGWAVELLGSHPPQVDPEFFTVFDTWFAQRQANTRTEPAVAIDLLFEHLTQVESTLAAPERVVPSLALLAHANGCTLHDGWIGGPGTDWDKVNEESNVKSLAYSWRTTETAVKGASMLQGLSLLFESFASHSDQDLSTHITDKDRVEFLDALSNPEVFRVVRDQFLYPLTHWELTDISRSSGETHDVCDIDDGDNDDGDNDDGDNDTIAAWNSLVGELHPTATGRAAAHLDLISAHLTRDSVKKAGLLESAVRSNRHNLDALDESVWMAAVQAESAVARARLDNAIHEWVTAGGLSRAVVDGGESATPTQVLRLATSVVGRSGVRHAGPQVGRNEPCPCGSGRKYKQCHLGKALDGINDGPMFIASVKPLVPWIQAVMLLWWSRVRPDRFVEMERLLQMVSAGDQRNILMTFVIDADLMDERVIGRFLSDVEADRGRPLSPALDRLVREWALQPMRLCEVLDRTAGVQLTLRDLVNGDRLIIEAPEVSKHYNMGDLLLTRVVSNGPALQNSFGVLPVQWRNRDAVLAFLDNHGQFPGAEAVANLVSGRVGVAGLVGPGESHIRNTDGDDIVFVDAMATLENAMLRSQAIAELLTGSQHLQVSGDHQWAIVRVDDPGHTHRGSIEMIDTDPVQLRIVTNSEARFDEAIALLTEILGGVLVGIVLRDSAEDVSLARDLGLVGRSSGGDKTLPPNGSSLGPDDLKSPEVLAQVREHLTQRWLSEKVPALGGLTPVEAANDPTRRQDLIRLLESFRAPSVPPMGMPKAAAVALGPDPDDLAARLGVRLR